ncbi:MAG: hypothetical protein KIT52_20160 [Anaerolineae bacterium]|nr:hypothetical protein [Anaerolineae bacterium]
MTTLTRSIAASSDDAQETSGTMALTGANLNANSASQIIGLRFTNITIPPGSTINSATLTVYVTSGSYDDPNLTIRGSGEADPTTFTSAANDITDRWKTSAAVSWNAGNIGAGAKNSPDLATLITEILAISGWASGNDMNFYITGASGSAFRINAYDNGSDIPQLTINYTEPAAGGQPPRAMHQIRMRLACS